MSHGSPSNGAGRALPVAGDVLAGKYALVRVIGEGGMGVVFEATHARLRQRVALKMLFPEMLTDETIVSRFEREARAAVQLKSRHVTRVMDVDVTPDGLPYMVMEFLEGHDLQTELDRRGSLPYAEVADYVLQACAAMFEAHHVGIVHRDLKPSNLFLAVDDGVRRVKVLDFGISKVQGEGDVKLTDAGAVMGTALYMSPEQIRSVAAVDARSDIWALGVILYELVAGRAPWVGSATQVAAAIVTDDPPDVRSFAQVPAEFVAVITRSLQRNPAQRFADVGELAIALGPLAPAGSEGRAFAESLQSRASTRGPAASFVRVDGEPAVRSSSFAATQAASEHRGRGAGTAPGWAQPAASGGRSKMALYAAFLGVAVTLALVGATAGIVAIKQRGAASAAPATSESSTTASSVAAPMPIPAGSTPLVAPSPAASSSGAPLVSMSVSASASAPRSPAHGPAKVPTSKPAEAPKEPKKSPPPAAGNNPLLL